jgi:GxxExxY protein
MTRDSETAAATNDSATDAEAELTAARTYRIIGAAMEVHNRLGHGFSEPVYQAALVAEFEHCGIPFDREKVLPVYYRRRPLPVAYRADFVCFSNIIVELKALAHIGDTERSQVMNYLKATGLARGLLLNFGSRQLEYRRILWASNLSSSVSSVGRPDWNGES